jgi:MOSC domain-containing protein YiiM
MVEIQRYNLVGDRQSDLTVHGGKYKAIYGYPSEHYESWKREVPELSFPWGTFGENLTTEGLLEETVNIGDRLKIGTAILTVTQPRLPCYKLALRFDREDMIKRLLISARSGFYFSVEQEGSIGANSEIELLSRDPTAFQSPILTNYFWVKTRALICWNEPFASPLYRSIGRMNWLSATRLAIVK